MTTVVEFIDRVLMNLDNETELNLVANEVHRFMEDFPLYPELG
jgi:glycine/serine hydroxymethyltransferase